MNSNQTKSTTEVGALTLSVILGTRVENSAQLGKANAKPVNLVKFTRIQK